MIDVTWCFLWADNYVLHERTTCPLWVDILNSSRLLSNLVFWRILSARKETPNFGHLSQRNWHKWTTALLGPVKGTHWDIFVTVYVLLARVVLVYQKAIVCCEDRWKRVWKVFPSIASTADLYTYMIDWSSNAEDRLVDWRCVSCVARAGYTVKARRWWRLNRVLGTDNLRNAHFSRKWLACVAHNL